jgi:hypothetical protein
MARPRRILSDEVRAEIDHQLVFKVISFFISMLEPLSNR